LAALLRKHGAGALLGALSGIAAAIATDPALDSSQQLAWAHDGTALQWAVKAMWTGRNA